MSVQEFALGYIADGLTVVRNLKYVITCDG